jgi:hypothetical protein
MRKMFLTAAVVVAALAVPAMASAAPQSTHVMTHSAQHLDTTSASGPATIPSANGPVWAYDNLAERYVVTPGPTAGTWHVEITVQGSFAGFASPFTGAADVNNGSVKGTIDYLVTAAGPPNADAVPAQQAPETGLGAPIRQMFGDTAAINGNDPYGHYVFTYTLVDGAVYTQTG